VKFKIRTIDSDLIESDRGELAYQKHLERIRGSIPKDLFDFFGCDFFHDGALKEFVWNQGFREIRFTLEATNISRIKDHSYVDPTDFKIHLKNVVHFAMHARRVDQHNDPLDFQMNQGNSKFYGSEINTLDDLLAKYSKNFKMDFYSLLVLLEPSETWLELVFSHILVCPTEPIAFELIRKDPQYNIPSPIIPI
jgi:hypothetical protein